MTGDVLSLTGREVRDLENPDVVSSAVPGGAFHVWTSADGVEWHSGPRIEGMSAYEVPQVLHADGVLAVGASRLGCCFTLVHGEGSDWGAGTVSGVGLATGEHAELDALWAEGNALVGRIEIDGVGGQRPRRSVIIHSLDRGATWSAQPCSADEAGFCHAGLNADGLIVRDRRSSTDGGFSWSAMTVDDPEGGFCGGAFRSVERFGHGWVATASAYSLGEGVDASLLHSTDGTSWTVVRDSGGRCGVGGGVHSYREPLVFEDEMWTVHVRRDSGGEPSTSNLLRSTDGRGCTGVSDVDLSGGFAGEPLEFQGRVVVPVHDDDDGVLSHLAVVG